MAGGLGLGGWGAGQPAPPPEFFSTTSLLILEMCALGRERSSNPFPESGVGKVGRIDLPLGKKNRNAPVREDFLLKKSYLDSSEILAMVVPVILVILAVAAKTIFE